MADRWHGAFQVDETWNYSAGAVARIVAAVGDDGARQVQFHAQVYRSMRENEQDKPKPAAVRKQITVLADTCQRLRDALEMDQNAIDAIDAIDPIGAQELRRRLADDAEALRNIAWVAEREHVGRGRPTEESRRYLLHILKEIWTSVHGKPARRHVDGSEEGPFADFVYVCVDELPGFNQGLDDLIREVLSRRRIKP